MADINTVAPVRSQQARVYSAPTSSESSHSISGIRDEAASVALLLAGCFASVTSSIQPYIVMRNLPAFAGIFLASLQLSRTFSIDKPVGSSSHRNMNQYLHNYTDLIDYFASDEAKERTPIAHPDKSVNQLVEGAEKSLRKAAVLIPITRSKPDHESHIVLTVRSENLRSHAGQISLPGGTRDEEDSDDIATALRESDEEIGLPPSQVEVIGQLGDMALPSGFFITPIVGLIEPGLNFTAAPAEVADIFQAPLSLILDLNAYQSSYVNYNNSKREILELHYEDYRIWGATAAMLYHLANKIAKFRNVEGDVEENVERN